MPVKYLPILGLVLSLLLCGSPSLAQAPEARKSTAEAFADAIHYLRIARWDLAKSNLEYLALHGDPVEVLALSQKSADSEKTLLDALSVIELAESAKKILQVLEQGRAAQQQSPALIEQEIARLGTSPRGRILAQDRLTFIYKEYAVPQLLRALADDNRANLHAAILSVLSNMGKLAVEPLTASLPTKDSILQRHIVWVLGQLGYRQAAPYLRQIIEDQTTEPEVKIAAEQAYSSIRGLNAAPDATAAELFYSLANDYYYAKITSIDRTGIENAKVWYHKDDIGLTYALVPAKVYNEIMTMRSCQQVLRLDSTLGSALSLWLSGALQMQDKLSAGQEVTLLGKNWPGAQWFVDTAGQRYLHELLARAERDRNAPVALGAVRGLDLTAGRAWLTEPSRIVPLADALSFPDRRVRIASAFALARTFPQKPFMGAQAVVPTLCEALRQTGTPRAIIMDASPNIANDIQAQMRQLDYDTQVATTWDDALELARKMRGPDLFVVGLSKDGTRLANLVNKLDKDFTLAGTAVVALADEASFAPASDLAAQNPLLRVLNTGASGQAITASYQEILLTVNQKPISKAEADQLALTAAKLLVEIIARDGRVYDISEASDTLIKTLHDPRNELVKLSMQCLSLIDAPANQQAIAAYALDDKMPMDLRLIALDRLGESARLWSNQLTQEQVSTLMQEVLEGLPSDYHSKAARVVGTLNLPSEIIKELVLRDKH